MSRTTFLGRVALFLVGADLEREMADGGCRDGWGLDGRTLFGKSC
jgi:hypothetical protein